LKEREFQREKSSTARHVK